MFLLSLSLSECQFTSKNNLSVLSFKTKYTNKSSNNHIPNSQQKKLLQGLKINFKHLKSFIDASFLSRKTEQINLNKDKRATDTHSLIQFTKLQGRRKVNRTLH
jgi:hypothetical protein